MNAIDTVGAKKMNLFKPVITALQINSSFSLFTVNIIKLTILFQYLVSPGYHISFYEKLASL